MYFHVMENNRKQSLMTGNFLLDYLSKQKDEFIRNYKIAVKTQDVDAVHDMRVATKRLNTLIRMLNFNEKANFRLKKGFKPMRFVYKQFGNIRDFQVLGVLVAEFQTKTGLNLTTLVKECETRAKTEINLLKEVIRYFQYSAIKRNFKLINRYIRNKTSEELCSKIMLYREDRAKLLEFYSDKLNKERDLHEARKMIKDTGYLMEMLTDELPDFATELKTYKELGSLLGTWHDREVLLAYLKSQRANLELKNIELNKVFEEIVKERSDLEDKYYSLISF